MTVQVREVMREDVDMDSLPKNGFNLFNYRGNERFFAEEKTRFSAPGFP